MKHLLIFPSVRSQPSQGTDELSKTFAQRCATEPTAQFGSFSKKNYVSKMAEVLIR